MGACTLLPFQQSTLSPIIAYQRMCLCVLIHCSAITITINITVDNVLLFLRSGTYIGMYCIAIVFIMRYVTEVLNTHTQKVSKLESDNSHSSIFVSRPLSTAYAPVYVTHIVRFFSTLLGWRECQLQTIF